jgi:hypothetical protein
LKQASVVIASNSEAIQTKPPPQTLTLDCFALLAMTAAMFRLKHVTLCLIKSAGFRSSWIDRLLFLRPGACPGPEAAVAEGLRAASVGVAMTAERGGSRQILSDNQNSC